MVLISKNKLLRNCKIVVTKLPLIFCDVYSVAMLVISEYQLSLAAMSFESCFSFSQVRIKSIKELVWNLGFGEEG